MTRFRLNSWGTALVRPIIISVFILLMSLKLTDNFDAADGPPEELLAEWNGTPKVPHAPKPRGLRGPTSAASASVSASGTDVADFGSALLTCATPWLKSIASAAVASLVPPAPEFSRNLHPPTRDTERLSSPPPAIEDELAVCMKAFAASRVISVDLLDKAVDGLDEVCYTPDIMGDVTAERLQSLTGFPEGHAIALRKFARDWCGKIDAKRARRTTRT
jgi:hypothetical protein